MGAIFSTMLISAGTTALIFHIGFLRGPLTGIKAGTAPAGAMPLYI